MTPLLPACRPLVRNRRNPAHRRRSIPENSSLGLIYLLDSVENYMFDAWNQLLHGVKAGEVPFLKAHGVPIFEYLEQHPEDLQVFGESMTSVSGTENPAIAAGYKFSALRTLVDVAGGHGSLLATILKANPKLRGCSLTSLQSLPAPGKIST